MLNIENIAKIEDVVSKSINKIILKYKIIFYKKYKPIVNGYL